MDEVGERSRSKQHLNGCQRATLVDLSKTLVEYRLPERVLVARQNHVSGDTIHLAEHAGQLEIQLGDDAARSADLAL